MNREEAIIRLEQIFDLMNIPKNQMALQMAIDDMREQEERRWIPVTERLPEIGRKCLIANREIVVRGWLRPDGVWKTGVSSDEIWSKFSLYQPTHWMPLPEPPKGVKDNE